jgi:ATP-dependent Clp protease protease subunit
MKNRRLLNLFSANAKRGTFKAAANVIELYDVIVSSEIDAEWFGGVSLPAFAKAIEGMTGDVHLRINSPGGDVFAGIAMAQLIREYKGGQVIAHVDGYAASAASLLPLACAKTIMAPQSMLMIHSAWTIAMGNSEEFLDTAALLAKIDGQVAEGYAGKGNKSAADFLALMAEETWFTPQEAIDAGLCDEIAGDAKADQAQASASSPAWDLTAFEHAPKPAPTTPTETAAPNAAQVTAAAEAAAAESERQHRVRALQALLVSAA